MQSNHLTWILTSHFLDVSGISYRLAYNISITMRGISWNQNKRDLGAYSFRHRRHCFHVGRSRQDLSFCQFSTQFSFWRRNKPCDSNHQTQSTKPRRQPSIMSLDVCTVIICLLIHGVTETIKALRVFTPSWARLQTAAGSWRKLAFRPRCIPPCSCSCGGRAPEMCCAHTGRVAVGGWRVRVQSLSWQRVTWRGSSALRSRGCAAINTGWNRVRHATKICSVRWVRVKNSPRKRISNNGWTTLESFRVWNACSLNRTKAART